jgi:hypothetical protein
MTLLFWICCIYFQLIFCQKCDVPLLTEIFVVRINFYLLLGSPNILHLKPNPLISF